MNDQNYPPLEVLERSSLRPDCIYLLYNAFGIYMYVGRTTDSWFLNEIFKVQDFSMIDKSISEDEIFANMADSTYLTALCNIIS